MSMERREEEEDEELADVGDRMTETSPVSFMTTIDDPMQKKLDSVGRLLPHVSYGPQRWVER